MDPVTLRNRLLVAAGMWKETVKEPLPKMPPGNPEDQVRDFEIALVDRLCNDATPQTARDVADRTWDLVHDRPDNDPVKMHVTEWHERLARMGALRDL